MKRYNMHVYYIISINNLLFVWKYLSRIKEHILHKS